MKKTHVESDPANNPRDGESTANPAGGSRRRLLRALGKSGGVAVAALLAGRWRTPVVRSVMLPAHAQTSAGGCVVSVEFEYDPDVDVTYNISIVISGTGGSTRLAGQNGSVTGEGGTATVSGSSIFPPGTYTGALYLSETATTNPGFAYTANASCCDQRTGTNGRGDTSGQLALGGFVIRDDGTCEVVSSD